MTPNYVVNNIRLEEVEDTKDPGVIYNLLLFDKQVSEKVNKGFMMLGIFKRNFLFVHISRKCFVILYKSHIHHISYSRLLKLNRTQINS